MNEDIDILLVQIAIIHACVILCFEIALHIRILLQVGINPTDTELFT